MATDSAINKTLRDVRPRMSKLVSKEIMHTFFHMMPHFLSDTPLLFT